MKSTVFLVLLLFVCSPLSIFHKVIAQYCNYRIVCFYENLASKRPGIGNFQPQNLDPFTCTHGLYSFAILNETTNTIGSNYPSFDIDQNGYKRFTNLAKKNPAFRAMLSIGRWFEGSVKYSNMVSSPNTRATFVQSVLPFLQEYGFHGLDVDWEYPTERGGKPEDKKNFALLLQELREEFDKHGLLLSATVNGRKTTIDNAYDVPKLNEYLDFINIMNYEYHSPGWETFTDYNAPLYASASDTGDETQLNANFSVTYWIQLGASPKKLNLGIPAYGHSYTLASTSNTGLKATAGLGNAFPITNNVGSFAYLEICDTLRQGGWTTQRDDKAMVPYSYKGNQWVSYDDITSVQIKSRYVHENNLGGVSLWSVVMDDFHGTCGEGVNPLLSAIEQTLRSSSSETIPTTFRPTSTETAPSSCNCTPRPACTCRPWPWCTQPQAIVFN